MQYEPTHCGQQSVKILNKLNSSTRVIDKNLFQQPDVN